MPPHRLRIRHLSDLRERFALDRMSAERKTKVRVGGWVDGVLARKKGLGF
jgi:hypothetical protein